MFLVLSFSRLFTRRFCVFLDLTVSFRNILLGRFTDVFFNSSFTRAALHITTPDKIAIALVILLDLDRVETAPTAHSLTCPVTRGCGRVPL